MAEKEYIITLVRSAQGGDSASFAELYNLYYQKVFAFIRTIVRNSADAEDILQLTFLNAWRNLDQLSDPAAFNTWIQVIARNLSTSHLRKKNFVLLLDAEKDDSPVDIEDTELLLPEVYAEQEDLSRRLGKIIDSLSDVQRQTVMLFYFDQLSVDEIAQVMECSTGTVKSRLFLARKTIRTEIEEQERKSGQKFYGIAGLPMLGLSEIFARQAEAFSLPSSTAGSILERISSTIAQEATSAAQSAAATGGGSVSPAAGTAAETAASAATGAATKAGISLGVKILAGVLAASVIGGGAWLVSHQSSDAPPVSSEAPYVEESASPSGDTSDNEAGEPIVSEPGALQWDALSPEQHELLQALAAATDAFDYEEAMALMSSDTYLGLYSEEYLKVFPENNNSMWGGIYDGEQMLYSLSFWTDGEGESDYWFHIPGNETYQEAQLSYPNFICLRHMTGEQGNENGPFRHVAYDAEDSSVLTNEGTAANGIRVGTEVTTRTSGGEEWRLIYEYDQQGNLTNYVVNDSGDTVMFYEGTDTNRSVNVNNYPMQATVIQ